MTFEWPRRTALNAMIAPNLSPCAALMETRGHRRIAVTRAETGSLDEVFLAPDGRHILVRFAPELNEADRRHLSEISSQGTFDEIFYVIENGAAAANTVYVETRLSDFERLI